MSQAQTATAGGESFAALFEESLKRTEMRAGEVITAEVVRVDHNFVVVNAGLKSEAYVPIEEFKNDKGELEVQVGDFVSVAIDAIENGYGDTILSRDKAKRLASWLALENVARIRRLRHRHRQRQGQGRPHGAGQRHPRLPARLADRHASGQGPDARSRARPWNSRSSSSTASATTSCCRAAPWSKPRMGEERAKLMETLNEGAIVHGVVKNITEYGAFVDLGGIDGLLHITDMAWRRVRHPSEVVQVGQELTAKVLKFDAEKNRVSLGLKQLGDDPWHGVSRRYPPGTRLFGKVTNIADYGAFVEIEPGIEGLVHVSEMDWTNKNVAPSKIVSLGDEVEVMVLEIDEDKRRISLGMKQCKANPWEEFAGNVKRGDRSRARSSRSPTSACSSAWRRHRRPGAPVRPVVERARRNRGAQLQEGPGSRGRSCWRIDVERERISLGIKQLDSDPFTSFTSVNDRGALVTGKVKTVDPRGAEIQLSADVTGYLRASEISRDRVEDARNVLKEGDEVNADDRQRRPQDALDPAVDQGQGHGRPARGDAAPGAEQRARERRHHQPGRAAARQAGQPRQPQRLTLTAAAMASFAGRATLGRRLPALANAVRSLLPVMP